MSSPSGTAVGIVSDLWRYPVASMGGERLRRAFLGPLGVLGDRRCMVADPADDSAVIALRNPPLLAYRAWCDDAQGGDDVRVETPRGDVVAWDDPSLAEGIRADIERDEREPVELRRSPAGAHADQPVALLAESTITQVSGWAGEDVDRRRFRPNVVIDAGDDPFPEDSWMGRRLVIGDGAEIEVVAPTRRSGVLSRDPDTAERDTRAHAALARERRNYA
ncbi:MAG: MOSC domain-containing protein, partial [Actinomycetota bacterium]